MLERVWIQEMADFGRESFWYFITNIMFPDTWQQHYTEDFHQPIADALESLSPGEDLALVLPRESRKSYLVSLLYSWWKIIKDPDYRGLVVGAKLSTVQGMGRVMKVPFQDGEPQFTRFQQCYPEYVIKGARGKEENQAYRFTVPARLNRALLDPTFRISYVAVTGAGARCDVLTLDDCVERKNCTNPEMALGTLRKMLDLLPLLEMNSKHKNLLLNATRWAYFDPIGHFIGDVEGQKEETRILQDAIQSRRMKLIIRHAFEDPSRSCEHCPENVVRQWPHGHPVPLSDPNGRAVMSPISSRDHLAEKLAQYAIDPSLGESMWWHQYQNVCKAPSNEKFKAAWFLDADRPGWPVFRKRVLTIDSAAKDFQSKGVGDYMVALFGEFDDNGRLMIRHGIRDNRMTRDEFIRAILAWCQGTGWWPSLIAKEKMSEDTFLTDIQRAFNGANNPVHCEPITKGERAAGSMAKFDNICEALQAPMERGEIVWGSACPRHIRLRAEYELCSLGQTTHDDLADALALFMSAKVRVRAPNRAIELSQNLEAPDLANYGAPSPAFAPPLIDRSPLGQFAAIEHNPQVSEGFDLLGFSDVKWSQSPAQVGPSFHFLPPGARRPNQ